MSAYTLLNTTARGNQPFTQVTQSWCSKQCFSPLRNSVRRECKVVCDSTVKQLPAGRWKQASSHGSQVADQPVLGAELQTAQRRGSSAPLLAVALCVGNILLQSAPAIAFTIHQEPENALSFPTWVIHISSVIEWAIAMSLVWKYAEVTGTTKFAICWPAAHCTLLYLSASLPDSQGAVHFQRANVVTCCTLLMFFYYVCNLLCQCQLQGNSSMLLLLIQVMQSGRA